MFMTPSSTPPASGAASAEPAPYQVPKESQDLVRKQEIAAYAAADDAADEQLDKLEKEALLAIRVSLGKDKWSDAQPAPLAASQGVLAIRKAKIKMRLVPVETGAAQTSDDFLQLKDEATDKITLLGRKSADGTATAGDRAQMMALSRSMMKLVDLKMQVMKTTTAALTDNSNVQTSSLTTMLRVSGLVRSRKMYSMEMTAEDYALVKRGLERQRRAEAIAATSMAMLAAYQAVINNNGDPRALDVIGDGALKSFPIKPSVTDEEAKAYVDGLGANVQKVKARYEAQMRKTWGDAKYERTYKAGIDSLFAQAEGAQNQKSATQIASDAQSKYKVDVGKCMRGEPVDGGSLVGGGTCNSLKRAAQTGDTSDLPPGALKAFNENGGATTASAGGAAPGTPGMPGMPGIPSKAKNAIDAAGSIASGDYGGALDSAAKMFPGDTTIGASLQGLSALKNGDPRGAINAALTFVPVPGLKDAFSLASKLLFK